MVAGMDYGKNIGFEEVELQLTQHSRIGPDGPRSSEVIFGVAGAADNSLREFVYARTLEEIG